MADVLHSSRSEEPAGKPGRGRKPAKKGSFWRELPILLVTAVILTVVIQAFVGRVYVIPSASMETTLHGCDGCNNDRVLAEKVTYRFTDPKPGDVVIFRGPDTWSHNEFQSQKSDNPAIWLVQSAGSLLGISAPDEKDFVKRVIATEGQTVQCCDALNRVMVNGKPINEPYLYLDPHRGSKQKSFAPFTVPPGRLWVMGDNRNNSLDSRYQGGGGFAGTVPVDNVIGKAQLIVLPPTRWSSINDPDPQGHP